MNSSSSIRSGLKIKMGVSERFQGANIIDAGKLSPYWGEHASRYFFALPYVEGKSVLDIACGTGYGIGLLKGKARFVVGVDVDATAAQEAREECSENAAVLLGDGLSSMSITAAWRKAAISAPSDIRGCARRTLVRKRTDRPP